MHDPDISFSPTELVRYHKQLLLPQVGTKGQQKLKIARVLCVGAGALGCVVLPLLTSAGIGHIGIADDDSVELSNLQRQTPYSVADLGQDKTKVLQHYLQQRNPEVQITIHDSKITTQNALTILKQYDYIVDCTDNIASRYLLNAACIQLDLPYIYAGIFQFSAQCSIFVRAQSPCFNCIFPLSNEQQELPNCAEGGVLSSMPAIIGGIQANEVFKLILDVPTRLEGLLLDINTLALTTKYYQVAKRDDCEHCGTNFDLATLNVVEPCTSIERLLTLTEIQQQLATHACSLLDVRYEDERADYHIGGEHIPLNQLPQYLAYLREKMAKPILIYCASGIRSLHAATYLRTQGIHCFSLTGGLKFLNK